MPFFRTHLGLTAHQVIALGVIASSVATSPLAAIAQNKTTQPKVPLPSKIAPDYSLPLSFYMNYSSQKSVETTIQYVLARADKTPWKAGENVVAGVTAPMGLPQAQTVETREYPFQKIKDIEYSLGNGQGIAYVKSPKLNQQIPYWTTTVDATSGGEVVLMHLQADGKGPIIVNCKIRCTFINGVPVMGKQQGPRHIDKISDKSLANLMVTMDQYDKADFDKLRSQMKTEGILPSGSFEVGKAIGNIANFMAVRTSFGQGPELSYANNNINIIMDLEASKQKFGCQPLSGLGTALGIAINIGGRKVSGIHIPGGEGHARSEHYANGTFIAIDYSAISLSVPFDKKNEDSGRSLEELVAPLKHSSLLVLESCSGINIDPLIPTLPKIKFEGVSLSSNCGSMVIFSEQGQYVGKIFPKPLPDKTTFTPLHPNDPMYVDVGPTTMVFHGSNSSSGK